MVKRLVLRDRVKQKDIAVLSQYRSQCSNLTGRLQHLSKVTVSTVIAAQGLLLLSVANSQRSECVSSNCDVRGFNDDSHCSVPY